MTAAAAGFRSREVVVTGAAGFIGRRLLAALARAGTAVTGVDRAGLSGAPKGARFHRADLARPGAARNLLREAEVVFHLAAANGHRASMENPVADFEDNVMGLLGVMRSVGGSTRVVLASTRQLYGAAESLPVNEDHPVRPPDVHSVHKEAAEHLLRLLAPEDGGCAALRLTNTYGPGQPLDGPGAGFSGAFLERALRGEEIHLFGDPDLLRDPLHVDEVVEALLLAGRPGAPSGVWNLGGAPVTLLEFAEAVFDAVGAPLRVSTFPLAATDRAIAVGGIHCDASRIRRDLAWAPSVSLRDGLRHTVRAFRRLAGTAGGPPTK